MTQIQIGQCGNRYTLRADGHATGSDETCACISTVLYGLAGYLINLRNDGRAQQEENSMGSGRVVLTFRGGAEVSAAYDMAEITLLQLSKAKPDYLCVSAYQERDT